MDFRKRWIDLFYRAATGTKKSRTLLTPIGVSIFGTFTALVVMAAILVDSLLNLPRVLPEAARFPVSVPMIAAGFTVTTWSVIHFLKVKGTPVPFNPPPKLVTTGPYRYARNPMLTGVFLLLFGIGFIFNSASLVFFFTPLYVLINVLELKNIEEPELIKRLGEEYTEYRRHTPMFIPRFRSRSKKHI